MKKLYYIAIVGLVAGCQKPIDLDIKNASPELIVDARIQSSDARIKVNLSQSAEFEGDNNQAVVSDAFVYLSVDGGAENLVDYEGEGNYVLDSLKIDAGTNYDLRITWKGQNYESSTEMLAIVPLLYIKYADAISFGPVDTPTYVFNMFLEPSFAQVDYYFTEVFRKSPIFLDTNFVQDSYQYWDDENYSSTPALFPYFSSEFYEGDSLLIEFSHIPFEVFQFYETLDETEGQNPSSLAPANPIGNISNGAIGYFGAFNTYQLYVEVNP